MNRNEKTVAMKVIGMNSCGHSPRADMLKEVTITLANGVGKLIEEKATDSLKWNIVGSHFISGKKEVLNWIETASTNATLLSIQDIITHCKSGAVHGELVLKDHTISFCDIYRFSSAGKGAKIVEITSYRVKKTI
ncbi:hypothetical protein Q75_02260 [Bacillus coahuilensis p1.1.43]|uniref:Uncharacterized protein n=1 Tax=Bacillus coahuilensis p1.1.43 TaxID=1150625 RepID=A0A147KBQ4_9BACI|nr:hypothetical protein [Bacillus coahuilensis]KUP08733.1 hypothetical protein Q75_02260 [Bacillus coahuilensis p1.1.43]